jgi:hypothetical protein
MPQFVLDFSCAVLNGMQGWTDTRKNNINDMYVALQSLYPMASANCESAAVFMTEKPGNGSHEFIYDVDTGMEVSRSHHGSGWYQDVARCIRDYLDGENFTYESLSSGNKRFCVWHNHPGGSSFSEADLALLVDYFPLIHSAYLDTSVIVRLVLSAATKQRLQDETFKNAFLCKIREEHSRNALDQQKEIEELLSKHRTEMLAYAVMMEMEHFKGESHSFTSEEHAVREIFKNEFDLLRIKYSAIDDSGMLTYFNVFRFAKIERSIQ